jgi:hypothetical protein
MPQIPTEAVAAAACWATTLASFSRALAYVDPGSSSVILNVLAGVLVGLLAALKVYWTRVKLFFARISSRKSPNDEPGT